MKTATQTYEARALINATGGHASRILPDISTHSNSKIRLVKGSHIITKRLYPHDKCYFFQGDDGRIIFAIPYQRDFTLIGTTEVAMNDVTAPVCSEAEMDYLCERASRYFAKPLTRKDIISHYAGLRALYNEGDNFGAEDATAATRDYVLELDEADGGAPVITVFGGKITTHRRLAEATLARLSPYLKMNAAWTASAPLKGGDFALNDRAGLVKKLHTDYPFLDADWGGTVVFCIRFIRVGYARHGTGAGGFGCGFRRDLICERGGLFDSPRVRTNGRGYHLAAQQTGLAVKHGTNKNP